MTSTRTSALWASPVPTPKSSKWASKASSLPGLLGYSQLVQQLWEEAWEVLSSPVGLASEGLSEESWGLHVEGS